MKSTLITFLFFCVCAFPLFSQTSTIEGLTDATTIAAGDKVWLVDVDGTPKDVDATLEQIVSPFAADPSSNASFDAVEWAADLNITSAWGDVTGTPTTLSGYGITDAATAAQGSLADNSLQQDGSFAFETASTVAGVDARGRLKIGDQPSIFGTDAAVLVSRDVSGAAVQGAHGFRDESVVDMTGWPLTGYACYDAVANVSATGNANHIRGIQVRPVCNVTGKVDAFTGINVETIVGAGENHNVYGIKIEDVDVAAGSVGAQYGLHINELTGGTTNVSLAVFGVNAISQFSGRMELIGGQESYANNQGSLRLTGGAGITGNIRMGGSLRADSYIATLVDFRVGGLGPEAKVIGVREQGWSTPVSAAVSRSAIDPTTIDLETLAETVNALIRDLHAETAGHGLIGN